MYPKEDSLHFCVRGSDSLSGIGWDRPLCGSYEQEVILRSRSYNDVQAEFEIYPSVALTRLFLFIPSESGLFAFCRVVGL